MADDHLWRPDQEAAYQEAAWQAALRHYQIQQDFSNYGFAVFNARTGERIDPRSVRSMEGDEFEGLGFNPADFFKQIRRSASVKAGAIVFGQAQVAYYDTLKQSMTDEEAFNMLAHTTECVIKGIAASLGPLAEALTKAMAMSEYFEALGFKPKDSGKEVPGGE